jgi:hypothetical protein
MIIKPKCPECGAEIKISIKKVEKLEAYIKTLESNNKELRATLSLMKSSKPKDSFADMFGKFGL